jgi:hypothetical protein
MNAREFVEAHAASLWGDSRVGVNNTGAAAAVERALELYTEICEAAPEPSPHVDLYEPLAGVAASCVCGAVTTCHVRLDAPKMARVPPKYCAECGGAIVALAAHAYGHWPAK